MLVRLRRLISERLLSKLNRSNQNGEGGQSLVIIAGAFVALVVLVGLVTDAAIIYVHSGHLRRATDAAAVSAVNQYRETRTIDDIYAGSMEFLQVQLPSGLYNAEIYWCAQEDLGYERLNYLGERSGADLATATAEQKYTPHDNELCSPVGEDPRKRVRVEAWLDVDLVFLSLVGFNHVRIFGQAESEAAVVNLVLVLDTSESMAYDTCLGDPSGYDCVVDCSENDTCEPFESVREAAIGFLSHMREGVDKAAVYHFDKTPVMTDTYEIISCYDPAPAVSVTVPITGVHPITPGLPARNDPALRGEIISLTEDREAVADALDPDSDLLKVYVRPRVPGCNNPARVAGGGGSDVWKWTSTNVGGGMNQAIMELVRNGNRDAAIWVIVLLTDGGANSTDMAIEYNGWRSCPPGSRGSRPYCRDGEQTDPDPTHPLTTTVTRHCPSQESCDRTDTLWYTNRDDGSTSEYEPWQYDADDYARDMADMASSYQIAVYTIGFGDGVVNYGGGGRIDAGERLLRYISDVGDDGDIHTAPCGSDFYWNPDRQVIPDRGNSCGNYYYAPDTNELDRVFESIASRVFTRITR